MTAKVATVPGLPERTELPASGNRSFAPDAKRVPGRLQVVSQKRPSDAITAQVLASQRGWPSPYSVSQTLTPHAPGLARVSVSPPATTRACSPLLTCASVSPPPTRQRSPLPKFGNPSYAALPTAEGASSTAGPILRAPTCDVPVEQVPPVTQPSRMQSVAVPCAGDRNASNLPSEELLARVQKMYEENVKMHEILTKRAQEEMKKLDMQQLEVNTVQADANDRYAELESRLLEIDKKTQHYGRSREDTQALRSGHESSPGVRTPLPIFQHGARCARSASSMRSKSPVMRQEAEATRQAPAQADTRTAAALEPALVPANSGLVPAFGTLTISEDVLVQQIYRLLKQIEEGQGLLDGEVPDPWQCGRTAVVQSTYRLLEAYDDFKPLQPAEAKEMLGTVFAELSHMLAAPAKIEGSRRAATAEAHPGSSQEHCHFQHSLGHEGQRQCNSMEARPGPVISATGQCQSMEARPGLGNAVTVQCKSLEARPGPVNYASVQCKSMEARPGPANSVISSYPPTPGSSDLSLGSPRSPPKARSPRVSALGAGLQGHIVRKSVSDRLWTEFGKTAEGGQHASGGAGSARQKHPSKSSASTPSSAYREVNRLYTAPAQGVPSRERPVHDLQEYLNGDPWDGCEDVATEELIEWFADSLRRAAMKSKANHGVGELCSSCLKRDRLNDRKVESGGRQLPEHLWQSWRFKDSGDEAVCTTSSSFATASTGVCTTSSSFATASTLSSVGAGVSSTSSLTLAGLSSRLSESCHSLHHVKTCPDAAPTTSHSPAIVTQPMGRNLDVTVRTTESALPLTDTFLDTLARRAPELLATPVQRPELPAAPGQKPFQQQVAVTRSVSAGPRTMFAQSVCARATPLPRGRPEAPTAGSLQAPTAVSEIAPEVLRSISWAPQPIEQTASGIPALKPAHPPAAQEWDQLATNRCGQYTPCSVDVISHAEAMAADNGTYWTWWRKEEGERG